MQLKNSLYKIIKNLTPNVVIFRCGYVFGFMFLVLPLMAEITYGYCSVKENKNGKDLFQLYGNVEFDCKPLNSNFQQILLRVWIKKNWVYDDQQILAKAQLFNLHGKLVGTAIQDFTPYKYIEETDSFYVFELTGIISQACINPASVAEIDLNKILAISKQNAHIDMFKTHFKKYHYIHNDSNQKYQSYIITEPNFILQKQEPRLLVIFYKNELIAIFYSRNVIAKLYDSIEMGKEYKLIYNSKFTENTKTEMIQIFKNRMANF